MSDLPIDRSPDEGLAAAFRLPGYIQEDEELVALHRTMVEQLRMEAMGIPMNTMQTILIARIALKFVIIKYREENGWGAGLNTEKDTNAQWLDMVKVWNQLLQSGQAQMLDAFMEQAENISLAALKIIDDTETRQKVRIHFQESYAKLGA